MSVQPLHRTAHRRVIDQKAVCGKVVFGVEKGSLQTIVTCSLTNVERFFLAIVRQSHFTSSGGVELVVRMNKQTFIALVLLSTTTGCGGSEKTVSPGLPDLSGIAPAPAPTPSPTPAPTPPPPSTPAGWVLSRTLAGAEDLIARFDVDLGLQPAWGTGAIPGIYNAEEGAFRFTCAGDGKLAKDDPLVYYKQAGASHLHQVWGNEEFDADTTPADLAGSAGTNCNATPYSLNRSSYWMPALVHENGDVVRPDLVTVYYKRKTSTSAYCNSASTKFIGTCVGLPTQIRFIFGWDSSRPTATVRGASWYCTGGDNRHYADLDGVFASGCKAGDTLVANTLAPNCWDGKHLDSPDHRSHMAYTDYSRGPERCPASHPYLIPQEENKAMYTVTADMIGTRADGTKYSRVRLTSDAMLAGARPGQTLHADYMEAWVTAAKNMWMDHCIEKALSCSGGDLGNGKQLIGAGMPSYGWRIPNARVSWTG